MRLTTTPWKMYFDGSSTQGGAGAGLVFFSPNGLLSHHSYQQHFPKLLLGLFEIQNSSTQVEGTGLDASLYGWGKGRQLIGKEASWGLDY